MEERGQVPVSIFIMDVRGSSRMENPDVLTDYLGEIVQRIESWTNGVISAKAKHRLGDEIIFVGEHFFSAYVVANFIKKCWKIELHPPYFGATFGWMDREVASLSDLDTWNHRLIKPARIAAEKIKKVPHDQWLSFEKEADCEEDKLSFEMLCNLVNTQQVLFAQQTKPQQIACTLFSIFQKQTKVARVLNKSASTISNQLKQGLCETLLALEQSAGVSLVLQEYKNRQAAEQEQETTLIQLQDTYDTLKRSIQQQFKSDMSAYMNLS